MMLSFFAPRSLRSQTENCNFPVQCYDVCCDPELYRYINLPEPNQAFIRVSVLIAQGKLLPMTGLVNATNTPQRIATAVPIRVDVPYTFSTGSELVFRTNAADLDVQSKLTLQNSHLHGCAVVWDGIYVRNGATLLAYNNCIEDGLRAIRLFSGARYEIAGNSFQRNYESIFAGDDSGLAYSNVWQLGKGISSNEFSGLTPLLQTIQGAVRPRAAINVFRVTEMTVGFAGTGRNRIQDYASSPTGALGFGINSDNSHLTVVNTSLYNIGLNTNVLGGIGINTSSAGLQFSLTVTGLGGQAASQVTFSQCETSIHSQDSRLTIKQCRFDGATEHIRMNFPKFPHRFTITDNYFEHYRDFGIVSNAGLYRAGLTERNFFDDDEDNTLLFVTAVAPRHSFRAVGVISQGTSTVNFLRVRDNDFLDRKKNLAPSVTWWGSIGAELINVRNVADIDVNRFTQEHVNAATYTYQGVQLTNSFANLVRYNTCMGAANNPTPMGASVGMAAIDVAASGNNTIRCNTLSNVRDGLRFTDPICDGSIIWGNSMTGHQQGLHLLAGTIVGPQPERWNTWPGTSGQWEANNEADPFLVPLSRFSVQFPETPGNAFWPQPRNPTGVWFFLNGTPPVNPVDYCARDGNDVQRPFTTADDLVLSSQYPAYKGYAATQWEAAYFLYDRLNSWPDLRPVGSPAATFYDAQASTNLGKLHSALQQYGAVGEVPASVSASLETNYQQTDDLLAQVDANHASMGSAATEAEQEQLLQTLSGLSAQVQTLQSERASLSTSHLSERATKIGQLQTYLAAITTASLPEENLKSVLTVLTDAMAADACDAYTSAQSTTLEGMAAQCRYAGGYGVVLARVALKKSLGSYDDEAMCPPVNGAQGGGEDRNGVPASAIVLTLSPNPATNALQVGLPTAAFSKGQLRVWNMLGSEVCSMALQPGGNTATVDLSGLPNGTYLVEAMLDGQPLPIRRFLKASQ